MDISIGDNHKAALTQIQHTLQYLQTERTRIAIEARYVERQSQQLQGELMSFLQRNYDIDAQHATFTLDTERGVITVPDEAHKDDV